MTKKKKVKNRPVVIDELIADAKLRWIRRRDKDVDFPTLGRSLTLIDDPSPLVTEPEPKRGRRLISAADALVISAYEAAAMPQVRRRLNCARGLAITVTVPSASWVNPVSSLLTDTIEALAFPRDGSDARNHLSSVGNDDVAEALAAGKNVIGISQNPTRLLPEILVASADISLTISPPDTATIAKAMRRCLRGRMPKDLPEGLGAGLDFKDVIAALRPFSTPEEAVERLQAAAKARTVASADTALPTLEEAVFYGAGRDWGLALARDVESARRGEIPWSQVDRGAVFYGPPGTGKTWLCRIIARACNLPIFEGSVAELFSTSSGYLDGVIKAQRALFARAAVAKPCILLWDEIDALPNRATISPRGKDWWLPVISDFILCLSNAPPGQITIGAMNGNIEEDIDKAIMRPGRLERAIEIKPPSTAEGLAGILRFQLGADLAGADLVPLARLGTGSTAAIAMEWVRIARRTARTAKRAMTEDDLLAAIAPPDDRPPEMLRANAVHEAGHAIAVIVLGLPPVDFVSLIRDGISNGRMMMNTSVAMPQSNRARLEKLATMFLAGRAAEIVCFGHCFAGGGGEAASDIGKATRTVAGIHASLGLGDTVTFRAPFEKAAEPLDYDHELRAIVERELRRLQDTAEEIIRQHRSSVEAVAEALCTKRFLVGAEVRALFDAASRKPPPATT